MNYVQNYASKTVSVSVNVNSQLCMSLYLEKVKANYTAVYDYVLCIS